MSRQKVDNDMITGLTSSKLTGAMPAIDASALTGVGDGITKSASDPAIDTNPSDGVGALWLNTTDSNLFACTDATTDENIWYNVGGGEGNVQPWVFQGTISGYTAGGITTTSGTYVDTIDKFSLASDANATDVGNMVQTTRGSAGSKSSTHGYAHGYNNLTQIEKYSFSTDGNSVAIGGVLTQQCQDGTGQSSSTHGYQSGGQLAPNFFNIISKFAFATDGNATDVGDLTRAAAEGAAGHSAETHGYTAGGYAGSNSNVIDRFSFASDGNATDVGDMQTTRQNPCGNNSTTHGYNSGGHAGGWVTTTCKFAFGASSNSSNVSDITVARYGSAPQSSTTHGYSSGGYGSPTYRNTIDKLSFASDTNSTDVGDLTTGRSQCSGTQI